MYAKRVFFIVLLAVAVAADKTYQEQFNDAKDKVSNSLTEFQKSFMSNSVTESAMDSLRSSFKNFNDFASQSSSDMTQEMSDSMTETKKQLESQITSMMRLIGLDASDPSQISQFQAKLKGVTPDSMRSMLNEMFTTYGYIKGAAANQWWNMKDNVAKMTQSYSDALWNNNVADYLSNQYHQYFGPSADTYQEQFNDAKDKVSNSLTEFQKSFMSNSVTESAMDSLRSSFKNFNDFASQSSSEMTQEMSDSMTETKKQLESQITSMMRLIGLDASDPSQISQFQAKLKGVTPDSMRSMLNEMFTTYGYIKGAAANQWWNMKDNVAKMTQSYSDALWNNNVADYLSNQYHQYFGPSADTYQEQFQRAADDVSNSMQQFQSQYFTRSTAVTNEALEPVKLSFHRFNELARQAPDTLPDEVSHKLTRTKFLMSQQVTALMRQLGIDSNETSKLSELQSKFQQTSSDSMQSFLNEMFTTYGYVKGSVATEWWNVKENVAQMIKSYTNALWNNQVTEYVAMKYHQYIAPAADAVKQEL